VLPTTNNKVPTVHIIKNNKYNIVPTDNTYYAILVPNNSRRTTTKTPTTQYRYNVTTVISHHSVLPTTNNKVPTVHIINNNKYNIVPTKNTDYAVTVANISRKTTTKTPTTQYRYNSTTVQQSS
jgi:hypothetical protein